jgi:hypothetical protein
MGQAFRNLIVHGHHATSTFDCFALQAPRRTGSSPGGNFTNNVVYDIKATGAGFNDTLCGLRPGDQYDNVYFYNNTVHDIASTHASSSGNVYGAAFADDLNNFFKNNIITDVVHDGIGSAQCFQHSSPSNATCEYNLSSDSSASGTGSLTSKASSNQFVSTTGGSEDLHLKPGADAIDAGTDLGTTPSGVEIDIDGRDRDAEGDTWDMGAHELVVVSVTHTTDALLKSEKSLTHTTDALLKGEESLTQTTDALLASEESLTPKSH